MFKIDDETGAALPFAGGDAATRMSSGATSFAALSPFASVEDDVETFADACA
jgi:hypothetical protein